MNRQNFGRVMRRADIHNAQDVESIAIPDDAHILRQPGSITQTETHISGVLRLLRGEKLAPFERPSFRPQAMIGSIRYRIRPCNNLFANGVFGH